MHVYNIDALMRTPLTDSEIYQYDDIHISTNGDFVYFNNTKKGLTVTKLEDESSQFHGRPKNCKYVVVKDGIISYDYWNSSSTPVLWSSDFTQELSTFHQLAGMNNCLSVSDEIIACISDEKCVKFFNVSTKQIVHEMSFNERDVTVIACSIKYHVLMEGYGDKIFLWKDRKKIDAWTNLFCQAALKETNQAEFSPEGNTLALTCVDIDKLFVFDIVSASMLHPISFAGECDCFEFFDEKNLICSFLKTIYLINVERGEILACLKPGVWPFPISLCRKQNIVCVGLERAGNFQSLEIILPRM